MIERRKCTNKGCRKTHRLLPDILIPYKQYCSEVVEDVIDEAICSDDIQTEDYPCEKTMERWKKWETELVKNAEGHIRSAAYMILNLSEEFLGSTESLLKRIKERITHGWLAVTLRFMINTGGSCLVDDSS